MALVAFVLFVALVASWVVLPGSSTIVVAEPEIEAVALVPSTQGV